MPRRALPMIHTRSSDRRAPARCLGVALLLAAAGARAQAGGGSAESAPPADRQGLRRAEPPSGPGARHWSLALAGHYQLFLDRPTSAGGTFPSAPVVGGEATLHGFPAPGFAVHVDGGYGWTTSRLTGPLLGELSYRYALVTFGAGLSYAWQRASRWVPFAGLHLATANMTREFADPTLPRQAFTALTPGVFAGLKLRLTQRLSLVARARAHYLLYDVDGTRHLGSTDLGALVDYEFGG